MKHYTWVISILLGFLTIQSVRLFILSNNYFDLIVGIIIVCILCFIIGAKTKEPKGIKKNESKPISKHERL